MSWRGGANEFTASYDYIQQVHVSAVCVSYIEDQFIRASTAARIRSLRQQSGHVGGCVQIPAAFAKHLRIPGNWKKKFVNPLQLLWCLHICCWRWDAKCGVLRYPSKSELRSIFTDSLCSTNVKLVGECMFYVHTCISASGFPLWACWPVVSPLPSHKAKGFVTVVTVPLLIFWCTYETSNLSHTATHTQAHDEYTQIDAFILIYTQTAITHTPCQINNECVLFCYRGRSCSVPPTSLFSPWSPFSPLLLPPSPSLPIFFPFSWVFFPLSFPLSFSSRFISSLTHPSLADESTDQLQPLKWQRLAPSHWFSSRRRGAEVLGERAGDERSYKERKEERKGWEEELKRGFNWEDERSWRRSRRRKRNEKKRGGLG